ncbi:Sec-independent protein translocase protein TatB [Aureimonas mangrovi]|uniref:Sec-independent protein translocase protein TatB n=1 Tax=Aureimonas mangrovi TaxID=2758041 RepID=UPI00163DC65C|nr:Sec-independent protein translocase protein TatB [Aureimonas mangrovi]
MFEIGWVELLVIAVVMIVVVGPKDLPGMLRTFGRTTSQLRRMAGDFRRQFDDALREAELDELRKAAADVKKLDPTSDIRKAMNPMKAVGDEIRSSLKAATKAPEPRVPPADAAARPMPVTEGAPSAPDAAVAGQADAAPAPVMEPIGANDETRRESPQEAVR